MTLRDWKDELDRLVKNYPYLLDCQVVYSEDYEGNAFKQVHYLPSFGVYDKENDDFDDTAPLGETSDAVCLN